MIEPRRHPAATLWVCIGLALLVVLVYGKVVRYDFVNFDDDLYVYDNPHIAQGLTTESVSWAFTTGYSGSWHPITWISHMVDVELFGLNRGHDSSILQGPGGHHLTNLLLHLFNTLLLFIVLKAMTDAVWPAAWVAAIFAVHPMHVESVAWVSERKDVLSGLFWMLTMLAYVAYTRRRTGGRYVLVLAIYAVGLGSKAMLVTLPCVLLLLDFWPLGRFDRAKHDTETEASGAQMTATHAASTVRRFGWLVLEKLPLFALALANCIATFLTQRADGSVQSLQDISFSQRLISVPIAYLTYISKMVWPSGLAFYYPRQDRDGSVWLACFAFLILAMLTILAVRYRNRWPWYFVGWLWFLGTLVPVIGIVHVGEQAYADRFTYLPYIGLLIAMAFGIRRALSDWPYLRAALAMVVVTALATCAWFQTSYWQNGLTLFARALDVTENNFVSHSNLGAALQRRGHMDKARIQYQAALRIWPEYADVYSNLASVLLMQGDTQGAVAHYRQAVRFKPESTEAQANLAFALKMHDQIEEALALDNQALQSKTMLPVTHFILGNTLHRQGHFEVAVQHYREALRLKPDAPPLLHNNLGIVLGQLGHRQESLTHFREALRLDPEFSVARKNLRHALEVSEPVRDVKPKPGNRQ